MKALAFKEIDKKNSSSLTKGRKTPIMIPNSADCWFSCGVRKPKEKRTNEIQPNYRNSNNLKSNLQQQLKYNNLNITENIRGGNYGI
jgi:hypothetical protein